MEGPVPRIIILALGAGALGGHDALHLLLQLMGRSPLIDLAISVFVVGMVTGYGMGNVLLARFVTARAGVGARRAAPPGADHLAQMTLVVSVGVGLLVTACLLAERGGFVASRRLVGSAERRPSTALFFVIAAAAAVLLYTTRILLKAGTASGPAHAASSKMTRTVRLIGPPLVAVVLLAVLFAAPSGLDSARLFPGSTDMLATVATAVVAGAILLACFLRMSSNAAGASDRAAPTHAADTRRFAEVTSLGVGFVLVLVWLLGATFAETDGSKYTCSARCPPPVPEPPTCM